MNNHAPTFQLLRYDLIASYDQRRELATRMVLSGFSILASRLIKPRSTNVSYPFDDVVVRIVQLRLKHFEVSDLGTNTKEARNRKLSYDYEI